MTTTETTVQQPSQGHEKGHGRPSSDSNDRLRGTAPEQRHVTRPDVPLRGVLCDPPRLERIGS